MAFSESPKYSLPRWLANIFIGGPKAHVLLAGVQFSLGMTLFVFSSGQVRGPIWFAPSVIFTFLRKNIVTRLVIATLAGLHAIALVFFSSWFAVLAAIPYVEKKFRSFARLSERCHEGWKISWRKYRGLIHRRGRNEEGRLDGGMETV